MWAVHVHFITKTISNNAAWYWQITDNDAKRSKLTDMCTVNTKVLQIQLWNVYISELGNLTQPFIFDLYCTIFHAELLKIFKTQGTIHCDKRRLVIWIIFRQETSSYLNNFRQVHARAMKLTDYEWGLRSE